MSDWANYIKEREGHEIIETDEGFIEYHIVPGDPALLFIDSFYIKPEFRRSAQGGTAGMRLTQQAIEAGLRAGCVFAAAEIHVEMLNATHSLRAALAYGMRLHSTGHNRIMLIKRIGGE